DEIDPALAREPVHEVDRAVAADADQPVELEHPVTFDDLVGPVDDAAVRHRIGERVTAIGGTEDRGGLAQQLATESSGVEDRRIDRPRHQPLDTVPDADDLPALLTGAMQHDRAQDRVEPGAVAAAGENADSPFRTHVSLPGRRAVAVGGLYHAA